MPRATSASSAPAAAGSHPAALSGRDTPTRAASPRRSAGLRSRYPTVEPQDRPVGMAFQNYALWPNMTVATTWLSRSPPVPAKPAPHEQIRPVDEVLKIWACPRTGAIGQWRWPAAAGRPGPRDVAGTDVVLFDEPLSNITRSADCRELRAMQQDLGFTAVYVTHDQAEWSWPTRSRSCVPGKSCRPGRPATSTSGPAARRSYRDRQPDPAPRPAAKPTRWEPDRSDTDRGPRPTAPPTPPVASRAHRWWIDTAERSGRTSGRVRSPTRFSRPSPSTWCSR